MCRVFKEKTPECPKKQGEVFAKEVMGCVYDRMKPRSFFVYLCPFSVSTTSISPALDSLGGCSSQGQRQSTGLRTRISGPRKTLLRECFPRGGHGRSGLPLFSEDKWVVVTETDVC